MMKYRIHWRSKETFATGNGEPVFDSSEMAQIVADGLTEKSPYLEHWIEPVAVGTSQAALDAAGGTE